MVKLYVLMQSLLLANTLTQKDILLYEKVPCIDILNRRTNDHIKCFLM
jgi:hypothetical protein